ncbi:MAG: hypothetical protein QOK43_2737 [Acidimicrobiaceae bacterium]|jgi:hypothetical protein|nr:hypothetical protein [Acidimicrobiaceae bacterium]
MRRVALCTVTLLAATGLMAAPPAAIATQTGSCNGHGVLITSTPVRIDVVTTADYYFTVQGVCMFGLLGNPTFGTTLTGTGVLTGRCGAWTGQGVVHGDHDHDHELVGTTWFIGVPNGKAVGQFEVAPDISNGQSCVTGASRWLLVGGVELL